MNNLIGKAEGCAVLAMLSLARSDEENRQSPFGPISEPYQGASLHWCGS